MAQHGMNIKLAARPGERPRSFDIVGIEFKHLAREMLRHNVAYRRRFFSNLGALFLPNGRDRWRRALVSSSCLAPAEPVQRVVCFADLSTSTICFQ